MSNLAQWPLEGFRDLFMVLAWSMCWLTFWLSCAGKFFSFLRFNLRADARHHGQLVLAICGLVVFWCPIPGLQTNLAAYVQGLQLIPSIGLLLICFSASQAQWAKSTNRAAASLAHYDRKQLLPFLLCVPFFFYPPALGFGLWDPYRLGYLPGFILTLATVNLCLWGALLLWRGRYAAIARALAIWLTLSLIAHDLTIYESPNLWDTLFDPFSIMWAIYVGLRDAMRWLLSGRTQTAPL